MFFFLILTFNRIFYNITINCIFIRKIRIFLILKNYNAFSKGNLFTMCSIMCSLINSNNAFIYFFLIIL